MKNFASVAIFLAINWLGFGALDRVEDGSTGGADRFLIGLAIFVTSIAVPAFIAMVWQRKTVIAALALLPLLPGCIGQRVVGNQAYVTVSNVWDEMDALPLANGHCSKYGRIPRFSHMEGNRAIYDCVVQ